MRIGIDISQVVYGTGVSSYTRNLVEALLRIDGGNEHVLFFSSLRQKLTQISKLKSQNYSLRLKTFKFPPTLLDILWNRLHILPIEKLIGSVDVFHTSDWTEPPAKCPKVTTIHDLTPLLFPEETHSKIVAVHKRKLEWVKKESKLIIAVSESTKKDAVRVLGIPEERIRVVYEACNTGFTEKSTEDTEKIKRKYGIKGEYILAFGGSVRKNIARIKKASVGHALFVVGQPRVDQEDLPALYSEALCFVYPSLYEGFGLPILEAMACGCPVVTSNTSSMPEVAGKAAVLVDPLEVGDIARGIEEAIVRREEMVKRGYKRVKDFSWEKCAKETLKVYEEAVADGLNPKG